jgi:glyoxylase I family protein
MEQGGRFQAGIVVRELGPMADFYGRVIGLEYLGDLQLPGILMKRFTLGDAGLKLLQLDEPPKSARPGGVTAGTAGIRYLTVEVPDVAETVARCVASGCAVPMPTFEHDLGLTVAVVEDPEGNWVELIEPQ